MNAVLPNQLTLAGAGTVCAIAIAALLVPWIGASPYDLDVTVMLAPPSAEHWLGTDELGRDLLARTLHAARISLAVGVVAASIGFLFGTAIGILAAYAGGWVDAVLMRAMDVVFTFPAMLLAIVLMASLGTNVMNATLAIGIVFIPGFARLARISAVTVLRQEFVGAARAVGAGPGRILLHDVLPNIAPLLLVEAAAALSYAILLESTLSFLGLGAQPPEPSWGAMLNAGRGFLAQAPWLSMAPGAAVFLTVFGFTLLADGLRDQFDPRSARM